MSNRSRELAAKEAVMTTTKLANVVESTAIRPFQVNVPEADLTDLRRRIVATRLPEKETVARLFAGRATRLHSSARAVLGDRLRLAQGRGAS